MIIMQKEIFSHEISRMLILSIIGHLHRKPWPWMDCSDRILIDSPCLNLRGQCAEEKLCREAQCYLTITLSFLIKLLPTFLHNYVTISMIKKTTVTCTLWTFIGNFYHWACVREFIPLKFWRHRGPLANNFLLSFIISCKPPNPCKMFFFSVSHNNAVLHLDHFSICGSWPLWGVKWLLLKSLLRPPENTDITL